MTLGARRSRVLGVIWIMAGVGLLAGAVLLWVDRQTVSVWELPLAALALGVGVWLWSQRVTIDRHGITVSSLTGTERTLWAGIEAVEVQATWWRPALTIHRKGTGSSTSVRTSSGLTSSQRAQLLDVLHELSRDHGFTIRRSGAPDVASATDLPAADLPAADLPAADLPADDVPADDVPADDVPADDVPADDVPAADLPADDVPAADLPADDVPVAGPVLIEADEDIPAGDPAEDAQVEEEVHDPETSPGG